MEHLFERIDHSNFPSGDAGLRAVAGAAPVQQRQAPLPRSARDAYAPYARAAVALLAVQVCSIFLFDG